MSHNESTLFSLKNKIFQKISKKLLSEDVIVAFYENFIRLCNNRSVSQSEVCRSIGLDKSAPTRWSKGSAPNSSTLYKVADYFGVDPDVLLEQELDPKTKNLDLISKEEVSLVQAWRDADEYAKGIIEAVLVPYGFQRDVIRKKTQSAV